MGMRLNSVALGSMLLLSPALASASAAGAGNQSDTGSWYVCLAAVPHVLGDKMYFMLSDGIDGAKFKDWRERIRTKAPFKRAFKAKAAVSEAAAAQAAVTCTPGRPNYKLAMAEGLRLEREFVEAQERRGMPWKKLDTPWNVGNGVAGRVSQ